MVAAAIPHAVIGTAGHIDHGKTALVKALTGADTDRLKEEKARGISIDLGFAELTIGDRSVGVVDVPGHERFIRNMLAGAHALDLVLFTVAADDGVMPQTEEHLDILHLLGVTRGIIAVTKADLVDPARLAEVHEEIEILLAGTRLEGAPIVSVSSVTGAGLAELRGLIARGLATLSAPPPGSSAGAFRLPVDRAFALKGHGMVVTGTALRGDVATGAEVRILPGGERARVRSVEVHGVAVERAGRGQRIALNLVGAERAMVRRGDVVCASELTLITDRLDAWIELRPAARNGLRDHARVRVHLGTAERLGKLILLDGARTLPAKTSAYVQIVLEHPVVALRGDRFVLRSENARATIGGGEVVLPVSERHRHRGRALVARLETVRTGALDAVVAEALDLAQAFALSVDAVAESLAIDARAVRSALAVAPRAVGLATGTGDEVFTTVAKWDILREGVRRVVARFHDEHPLAAGVEMEAIRTQLPYAVDAKLFRAVVERLAAERIVERRDNLLVAPDHRVALAAADREAGARACAALVAAGLTPPDLASLATTVAVSRQRLVDIFGVLESQGQVVRVGADLFYAAEAIAAARSALGQYLATHAAITAAEYRDHLGVSRKFSIALLDYFDRTGVTLRVGDSRKLR